MRIMLLAIPVVLLASTSFAQPVESSPEIDYDGFVELTGSVQSIREARLLDREEFLLRAAADGALLLDTRSAAAFRAGHIEGALNLPFSDFTETALREVIGDDSSRPIYIYCNNNFTDNAAPVMSKKAPLALNIPTFINLHGYGYTNVWELGGLMPTSKVPWVSAPPQREAPI